MLNFCINFFLSGYKNPPLLVLTTRQGNWCRTRAQSERRRYRPEPVRTERVFSQYKGMSLFKPNPNKDPIFLRWKKPGKFWRRLIPGYVIPTIFAIFHDFGKRWRTLEKHWSNVVLRLKKYLRGYFCNIKRASRRFGF